jgi:hypothetical protein
MTVFGGGKIVTDCDKSPKMIFITLEGIFIAADRIASPQSDKDY